MTERRLLIDGLELHYRGVFIIQDLMREIQKIILDKSYQYYEKETKQFVTESGNSFFQEVRAVKEMKKYFELMIKLRLTIADIRDTIITVSGVPKKYHTGDVTIAIDGWSTTDYESRWMKSPWYFFVTGLINKYIYKPKVMKEELYLGGSFDQMVAADCRDLKKKLRAFLNLYAYETKPEPKKPEPEEKPKKEEKDPKEVA